MLYNNLDLNIRALDPFWLSTRIRSIGPVNSSYINISSASNPLRSTYTSVKLNGVVPDNTSCG